MELTFYGFIILLVALIILYYVEKINQRTQKMKYQLELLVKQAGITEFPIDPALRALIADGEEVKAVKEARKTLGLSLYEGKQYIEKLKANMHDVEK